ncbi:MAG TPA: hypothetical protein VGL56_08200 [Fimbriimonadaceae bacterium]|jgi:hypothetical protein
MKRNVRNVKNSLKFKAQPRPGLISVKIGTRKYTVPGDARMITNGKYIFLSFPACSELFEIKGKDLVGMEPETDATEAYALLNPSKKRTRRKAHSAPLPEEVAEALKNIPPGYKIGYGPEGTPRLVRKRSRGSLM